jgi:hypothetical protein
MKFCVVLNRQAHGYSSVLTCRNQIVL